MNILNIGPLEFILILVVMFLLLGPEGMIKTARQIGTWIRQFVQSPMWREILGYSREIRELPTKLVRDTGLEEDLKEIKDVANAATAETKQAIQDANQQIDQSLREAGSVEVNLVDGTPALSASPVAIGGNAAPSIAKQAPKRPVID